MNLLFKIGISVPNKVHIITDHLPIYLSKTLHYLSDQTMESVHQDFFMRMASGNYNVKNFRSRSHGKKLSRGVSHFNSLNYGYGV